MVLHRITDKSLVLATRFGSQAARIIAAMVLARFVAIGDYGLFDLILSVPGLVMAAGDFGVSRSLTTIHDLPEDELRNTGLVIHISLALIYGVLAIGSGWYYGHITADPRLVWVGVIMAASFVAQNVQASQMAMLARELRFTQWAGVEFLMMLATIATGIAVAFAGGGIFALALQQLLAQICGLIVCSRVRPLRWPRAWNRAIARRFFSFGWKTSLFQWTNDVQPNLARQAIQQLVGAAALRGGGIAAVVGAVAVGIYGRATQVCALVGQNLITTFDLILSPLFARAKDDPARLLDLLIRGSVGVTLFCSFGAAWLIAVAPELIRVVLGPAWADVPPVLRALAPAVAVQGLCYPCFIMAMALGQPLVAVRYALLSMIGLGASIFALWYGGELWHFAATQSLFSIIPTYYTARWGMHHVGYSVRGLARRMLPILAQAVLAGGVMWLTSAGLRVLTDRWLPAGVNQFAWIGNEQLGALIRLMFASLAGVLTGWALLAGIDRRNYRDLVGLLIRPSQAPDIAAAALAVEP